jgi:hypothetical protein
LPSAVLDLPSVVLDLLSAVHERPSVVHGLPSARWKSYGVASPQRWQTFFVPTI